MENFNLHPHFHCQQKPLGRLLSYHHIQVGKVCNAKFLMKEIEDLRI